MNNKIRVLCKNKMQLILNCHLISQFSPYPELIEFIKYIPVLESLLFFFFFFFFFFFVSFL